jgi:vesicle coat complex subunit
MNTSILCHGDLFIPFSFFRLSAQGRKHIQNMKRIINRVKQQQLSSSSSASSVLTSSVGSAVHNNKQKKQIDYQFHYDKMKSLLGEETHEKYQKILLQQQQGKEQEEEQKQQPEEFPRVLENEHDENFTKPERDLRAIQYDPCSEYYTYRKKKQLFLSFYLFYHNLCFLPFLSFIFFFQKYI